MNFFCKKNQLRKEMDSLKANPLSSNIYSNSPQYGLSPSKKQTIFLKIIKFLKYFLFISTASIESSPKKPLGKTFKRQLGMSVVNPRQKRRKLK